jgi:hypothetical protein
VETSTQLGRNQISALLTGISIVVGVFSLLQARPVIDELGFVHSFTPYFFFALALLTVSSAILWSSPVRSPLLPLVQLLFLIVALYLSPVLVMGQTALGEAYRNLGFTEYILHYGHLNTMIVWYHNWPALHILLSLLSLLVGNNGYPLLTEDFTNIASIFPFLVRLLCLPLLYLLFKNLLGDERKWWIAGSWLFYIADWFTWDYISPMGIGFPLLLALLVLTSRRNKQDTNLFLIVIVMSALTITHLFMSLAGFFILVLFYITKRLKSVYPCLLAPVMIVGWLIYSASDWFSGNLALFLSEALRLGEIFSSNVTLRQANVAAVQVSLTNLRLLYSAVFGTVELVGIILCRKQIRRSSPEGLVLGLATIPFIMSALLSYGGESFPRAYLLSLIPIGYFGTKIVRRKFGLIFVLTLLMVSPPFFFIARYGTIQSQWTNSYAISFFDFFDTHVSTFGHSYTASERAYYVVGDFPLGFTKAYEQSEIVDLTLLLKEQGVQWTDDLLLPPEYRRDIYQYVGVSLSDWQFQQRFYPYLNPSLPEIQEHLRNSSNYNLVYSNPTENLYVYQPEV